jgi:hypothetical protein
MDPSAHIKPSENCSHMRTLYQSLSAQLLLFLDPEKLSEINKRNMSEINKRNMIYKLNKEKKHEITHTKNVRFN